MATGILARFYEASSRLLKQCFKGSKSSFFTEIYWGQLFWDASWSDSNLLEASNLPVNWTWQCKIMYFSTTLWDSLKCLPFKVGIFNWPRRPYISSRPWQHGSWSRISSVSMLLSVLASSRGNGNKASVYTWRCCKVLLHLMLVGDFNLRIPSSKLKSPWIGGPWNE